eukprot:363632-Chlamydomonas_euryale.AAC.2
MPRLCPGHHERAADSRAPSKPCCGVLEATAAEAPADPHARRLQLLRRLARNGAAAASTACLQSAFSACTRQPPARRLCLFSTLLRALTVMV